MRTILLALAALPTAACSMNMDAVPVAGRTPGFTCRGDALGQFIGQPAGQNLGARMLAHTGARNLRWVAKGMMVTMDFREDRLTVYLDGANRVERAGCG